MNNDKLVFTVEQHPMGQPRARVGKYGVVFKSKKAVDYAKETKWIAKLAMMSQGFTYTEGPIKIEILACFPVPQKFNKAMKAEALAGKLLPAKKPDNDNIEKAVWDAMSGLVYKDDNQVVANYTRKVYSDKYIDGAVVVAVTKL